ERRHDWGLLDSGLLDSGQLDSGLRPTFRMLLQRHSKLWGQESKFGEIEIEICASPKCDTKLWVGTCFLDRPQRKFVWKFSCNLDLLLKLSSQLAKFLSLPLACKEAIFVVCHSL